MPPENGPTVRATHLKDDLWALDELGPAASRVKARLRPETLARVREAQGTEHLPIALNVEMAEAVLAEAGADGLRRWGTASLVHSFDGFFKPLFLGLTRVLGASPGTLFKAFPQGWTATYRGCGHFTVTHPGPGVTRLIVRGLPPELRVNAFLLAVCGSLDSAFRVSKFTGRAVLEPREPDAPDASWLVEWRAAE